MEIILSPDRTDAAVAAGYWQDRLLTDYLDDWVARQPDSIALVDNNSERGNRLEISWAELSQGIRSSPDSQNRETAPAQPSPWHRQTGA